ncbi:MAG: nucleotide exchange factor GrpE [Clostridiales bacterium]|nr:MAG: nucleotide exchange factor GrpE [Clostridiales bacterium]
MKEDKQTEDILENSEDTFEEDSNKLEEKSKSNEEIKKETKSTESKEDEALEQKFLRLSADFQNFKRRTENEKSEIYKSANKSLITNLIPIIDNFERALEHSKDSKNDNFVSGMEMVFKNLMEILNKEGLEKIEALGEPFDPNMHHAVLTEPSDEYESDYVCEEMQTGYMLNKKVLRPAMVKVSC